ncbi:hypothetical protein O3P69_018685 [Scylla paramamosain]|uniref:Parvovirus non-structural protein 1 helicase domain-containing protein n=1 Tax=Scylla paramamosain TaxID=85552 RepID=A0AAW0SC15_SCYPA
MDARRLEESETDQQTPFYTFVIRERPAPRQRGRAPDFTIADHGDHWHITFQSAKSNVPRKRGTICKFLGLGTNNIDIAEFFAWFIVIGDKKLQKINTFVLKGPTGTGKTLTLATLLNKLNTGTITRCADTNQFHLQNLLSRNFALFEEPRIGVATVDEYKLLLEGSQFEINVKNSDMEQLHRIPSSSQQTGTSTSGYHQQMAKHSIKMQDIRTHQRNKRHERPGCTSDRAGSLQDTSHWTTSSRSTERERNNRRTCQGKSNY